MVEVESSVGRPYDAKREARDNKYEQFLEQGDRTLAETPGEAEGYYRQASALIPYRPDAWLGLARATDAQGKSAESLPYYKQAFEPPSGSGLYSSFPADIASLARYGALCEENGQHQAALKVYNQACDRLNPKPKIPLQAADLPSPQLRARLDVVRGIALSESKEHSGQDRDTEAMEAFKQAASLEPNDPRVQYYLGYGCQKTGQLTASKTAFEKAARLDTDGTIRAAVKEKLDALAR